MSYLRYLVLGIGLLTASFNSPDKINKRNNLDSKIIYYKKERLNSSRNYKIFPALNNIY